MKEPPVSSRRRFCRTLLGGGLATALLSLPEGTPAVRAAPEERARRLAVVIGVEYYAHGYIELDYSADDARRLEAALRKLGYEVNLHAVDGSTGGVVKCEEAVAALEGMVRKAGPEDTVILFFAGHGSRRGEQDYLLFSDSDPERLEETALPLDGKSRSLQGILRNCHARHCLLILDACRSSATRASGKTGFAGGSLDKGFKERLDRVVRENLAGAERTTTVLYSCSPGETAKESDGEQGGLFTVRLAEALNAGCVEVGEAVAKLSLGFPDGVRQTPVVSGPTDLVVGKFAETDRLEDWLTGLMKRTRHAGLAQLAALPPLEARETAQCPAFDTSEQKDIQARRRAARALFNLGPGELFVGLYQGPERIEAERRFRMLRRCLASTAAASQGVLKNHQDANNWVAWVDLEKCRYRAVWTQTSEGTRVVALAVGTLPR